MLNLKWNIKSKLFIVVLLLLLTVLTSVNYFYYSDTSKALKKHAYDHLITTRTLKQTLITDYFNKIKKDLEHHEKYLIHNLERLKHKPLETLGILSIDMKDDGNINIEDYPDFLEVTGISKTQLQIDFINNYNNFKKVAESFLDDIRGIDLFIVSNDGKIVFNNTESQDIFRNINDEDLLHKGVLEAVQKIKSSNQVKNHDKIIITDLTFHATPPFEPVFFAAIELEALSSSGYVVVMFNTNGINRIMTDWSGLGRSGETYLLGADYKLRNESRFFLEEPDRFFKLITQEGTDKESIEKMKMHDTSVFIQKVYTNASIDALRGNTNTVITKDYRGIKVLSSYSPLNIEGLNWAILSEMDIDEAFDELYRLKNKMVLFSMTFLFFALIITTIIIEKLTQRIFALKKAAEKVSAGDYNYNITNTSSDEIGEVINAFNKMTSDLKSMESELRNKNVELEEKVKKRTHELQLAKDFFERIISTAASLVVGVDESGCIKLINRAFMKTTGYEKDELIGKDFFIFSSDDAKCQNYQRDLFRKALNAAGSGAGHFECGLKTEDAGVRSISWDIASVTSELGEETVICIGQDMTQRNKLEQNLRKKTKEMEQFVYSFSHDLKNPMISLRGFVDILVEDYHNKLDESGLFYLERLKVNSEVVNELLSGLLEVSRIGRIEIGSEDVNTNALIQYIIDENIKIIQDNNVQINVSGMLPNVSFPKIRLYQVLSNLLKNAIKFSREDTTPEIEIGCDESAVEFIFYVKDNGIGIKDEYHSQIFNMFSRLQEKEVEGTGIGLTIVSRIAEENNARVWVKSKVEEGTTFYFAIKKK